MRAETVFEGDAVCLSCFKDLTGADEDPFHEEQTSP